MIDSPEKITMPVASAGKCEVICNWRAGIKGDFLKLRVNDEEVVIPRSSFSKVAMWLASEEEQDQMIPIKQVSVRNLKKTVTIRLNRNMKMGEYLTVPVQIKVQLPDGAHLPIIAN